MAFTKETEDFIHEDHEGALLPHILGSLKLNLHGSQALLLSWMATNSISLTLFYRMTFGERKFPDLHITLEGQFRNSSRLAREN